jgi:type VI secretion system protein ImpG
MSEAFDDLLPAYERELASLRRALSRFARCHPEAAARLSLCGEHSEDPHVERILQSAALLNARADQRIDDDYPELSNALLEIVYPEYLRPFPSCSIACFGDERALAKLPDSHIIERGAELKTRTGDYLFHTVYDVTLAPLRIAKACYASTASIPLNVRLHAQTHGVVSITLGALGSDTRLSSGIPARVRLFVDGDCRMVAAVLDALLLHTSNAFAEADGNGTWIALDRVPLANVGFCPEEALIARRGYHNAPSQFRSLLEYCSFPEKFAFIELDCSTLMDAAGARGASRTVTLHLPIKDLHGDSARGQLLGRLQASNLKLFCTPIVNLFRLQSEPISQENVGTPVYPVVPRATRVAQTSIYSVDSVWLTHERGERTAIKRIEPYHSLLHHVVDEQAAFWFAERGGRLAELLPGQDMLLALVDRRGDMAGLPAGKQIDIDLTCTNANFPSGLQIGDAQGDVAYPGEALTGRLSMLRTPTPSLPRPKAHKDLWDLVSMLSAGALTLCQAGLPAFKRLLAAHAPTRASGAMRQADSLKHLARESVLEWVVGDPQPCMMRGIRVSVTVDETMLADCAVAIFARVLESLFVHYAPANSFIQLSVISAQSGAQLMRGQPVRGAQPLL